MPFKFIRSVRNKICLCCWACSWLHTCFEIEIEKPVLEVFLVQRALCRKFSGAGIGGGGWGSNLNCPFQNPPRTPHPLVNQQHVVRSHLNTPWIQTLFSLHRISNHVRCKIANCQQERHHHQSPSVGKPRREPGPWLLRASSAIPAAKYATSLITSLTLMERLWIAWSGRFSSLMPVFPMLQGILCTVKAAIQCTRQCSSSWRKSMPEIIKVVKLFLAWQKQLMCCCYLRMLPQPPSVLRLKMIIIVISWWQLSGVYYLWPFVYADTMSIS